MYWKTKYADCGMRLRKTQLRFCWQKCNAALPCAPLLKDTCGRPSSWILLLDSAESWPAYGYSKSDSLDSLKFMTLCLQKAFLNSSILDTTSASVWKSISLFVLLLRNSVPSQQSHLLVLVKASDKGVRLYSQAYANTRTPTHPRLFCYKASEGYSKLQPGEFRALALAPAAVLNRWSTAELWFSCLWC